MKKAFTLAEIMIVLSVIAVLTAVLLPAARNAMPNEDLMKFKKGHLALINTIQEMVNSDKYYLNGDLGIKPDNAIVDGTHDGDNVYFCEIFADILGSIKEKDCKKTQLSPYGASQIMYGQLSEDKMKTIDTRCMFLQSNNRIKNGEITLSDGIIFYRANPDLPFGVMQSSYELTYNGGYQNCENGYVNCNVRLFQDNRKEFNFYSVYNNLCMDIDGINKGEDAFGYALRVDGKIILGKRATDWFKKTLQIKD